MLPQTTLLFLMGVDIPSLLFALVILAIPGFFVWRSLLKFLVKKGPRGLNIAAVIMGSVQSPILLLMVGAVIYWTIVSREAMQLRKAQLSEGQAEDGKIEYKKLEAAEIDVVKVSPDKCKVLMENEYVRVLAYTIAPGEKDNTHTHPPKSYYVVDGGTLRVYPENGQPFDAEERQGTVEWGDYVGKHYVENIGSTTVKLLVTEVKAAGY